MKHHERPFAPEALASLPGRSWALHSARGRLLVLAVACLVLVLGCADDAPGVCDPRQLACQETIAAEVQRVRGGPPVVLPPVEVLTEAELRARIEREATALTPGEEALFEKWGRALMLLRLVSSPDAVTTGSIDQFVESVWGFYDRETGRITLIERPESADLESATSLFAHELTHHAQALDLVAGFATQAGLDDSLDAQDALSHHSEGEAVVVAALVLARMRGVRVGFEATRAHFEQWLLDAQRYVVDSPDPYLVARSQLRYPVGGAYLSEVRFDHGNDSLRTQWVPPVLTTASWMRGYESVVDAEPLEDCELPIAPAGYADIINERLGGELLFPMLVPDGVRDGVSLERSWEAASTWRGDHLRVYVDSTLPPPLAPVAVAYRVRAESADAATELEALFRAAYPAQGIVSRSEADVLVLLADDPGVWSSWAYPRCEPEARRRFRGTRMPAMRGLPDVDVGVTWPTGAPSPMR